MSGDVHHAATAPRLRDWIEDAERVDLAIYAAVARTPTPALDGAMSRLSRAADYSRLSLISAALLALAGGRTGRRAAAQGLASLACHRDRGQHRRQAARAAATPRPTRGRRAARAPCADAELAVVSLRALRRRLRVRDRRRPRVAGGRRPAARARRAGRLLARAHRRALPRRRAGRRADRHHARAAHDVTRATRLPRRTTAAVAASRTGPRRRPSSSPAGHRPTAPRSRADRTMTAHRRCGSMQRLHAATVMAAGRRPLHAAVSTARPRRSDIMADVETPGGSERDGQAKPKVVPHPTPAERAARGKAARAVAPRSAHGEWEPAADRRDPVELLEEQAASRVPELVPIRYGRMLVSPFTFFRGAAYPMAADLAGAPRTGLDVQLCGDAHLSNFGALRRARSAAGVQHQRLRRDAAGPVRVGRQAAGRQLRRGRPRSRLRRASSGSRSTGR